MFSGVANLLKPPGISSFAIIKKLRWLLEEKKVGHTGTLDPAAAGVLGVCLGKATKIIPYLVDDQKEYICEMKLGLATDTIDLEGEVVASDKNWTDLTPADVIEVITGFKGKQMQIPPMYSAIHHEGKRLYQLARQGIEVERPAREVEIYQLEIIKVDLPLIRFRAAVSRGTYLRSLVRDIADRLGSAGVMTFLLRTRSGPFTISNSVTIEEIEEKGSDILLPPQAPLTLPSLTLSNECYDRAANGNYLIASNFIETKIDLQLNSYFLLFSEIGNFLAIGQYQIKDDYEIYQPLKVFI